MKYSFSSMVLENQYTSYIFLKSQYIVTSVEHCILFSPSVMQTITLTFKVLILPFLLSLNTVGILHE